MTDKTWQYLKNKNVQVSHKVRNPDKTFIFNDNKKNHSKLWIFLKQAFQLLIKIV